MASEPDQPLLSARGSRVFWWSTLYTVFVVSIFSFPFMPSSELDPSWRMALGYFFEKGMQFGRDVIFTYGPLGFLMGKTYSGLQFWWLIVGQLVLALIAAAVILWQGRRLQGKARFFYFGALLLFSITYEDALHMIVITILGFELLRMADENRKGLMLPIAAVLAVYAQIKFTDLLLTTFVVAVALGYNIWQGRRREAGWLALSFLGIYLGIWIACGQNPLNLPAYFYGSWQISEGYQWAMGIHTSWQKLCPGLIVLGVLVGYIGLHLFINPAKPRAVANALLLGAFTYLNWKHGFVRSDGHVIGFYFCAMLPLTAYPTLLDDPPRLRRFHGWVFIAAFLFSLWSLEHALYGVVRGALAIFQDRAWRNVADVISWDETDQRYRDRLTTARNGCDLVQTRKLVGRSTLDVLGFEQGVAIFNNFNYQPRPVIQSYSTFMPALARLNGNFYASDKAPEYVLMKLQAIDDRLPTLDDAQVLAILAQRYEFMYTERDYQLWRRNPEPYDAAAGAPRLLQSASLKINDRLPLETLAGKQPLWLRIDLQPSLLGKIRSFLYKPPQVTLSIEDTAGNLHDYLMPLPQGRNGFIVNPLIEDLIDYMQFAANRPQKLVRSVSLKIEPYDKAYFADFARIEVSALPVASSGAAFFPKDPDAPENQIRLFKSQPVAQKAYLPISEAIIDGMPVALLHAPSQMIFDMPPGARTVSGKYGFLDTAYSNGGHSNGARFVIYWSNGTKRIDLLDQYLDPVRVTTDRGLHSFSLLLKDLAGGRLYLETNPGPYNDYGWDWTCWTDVSIAK